MPALRRRSLGSTTIPGAAQNSVRPYNPAAHAGRATRSAGHLAGAQYGRVGPRGPQRAASACRPDTAWSKGGAIPYQPCGAREEAGELQEPRDARPGDASASSPACRASPTCRIRSRSCSSATRSRSSTSISAPFASLYMNGNPHPKGPIEWFMGDSRGALGRQHAGRRRRALHRSDLARPRRELPQRGAARRRALHADRTGPHALRGHDRGPEGLHAAVEDEHAALSAAGGERRAARVRVSVVPARRHVGQAQRASRSTDLEVTGAKLLLRGRSHCSSLRLRSSRCRCVRPPARRGSSRRHRSCRWRRTWVAFKAKLPPLPSAAHAGRRARSPGHLGRTGRRRRRRHRRARVRRCHDAAAGKLRLRSAGREDPYTRVGAGQAERAPRRAVARMAGRERRAPLRRPGFVLRHDDRAPRRRR